MDDTLLQISNLDFCIQDVTLFLDTHPNDQEAKKYYKEHYTLDDTELYISSGIGTSAINFRFFNRPSINFYRLTNK